MAISAGTPHRQDLSGVHLVDRGRLGVQADGPGRGRPSLGHPQEQAQDELRKIVERPALLLRQKHHPQDCRQTLRLSFRLRPADLIRVSNL